MDAFVVDGVRTGIGSFTGSLSGVRADDLAAFVLRSLVKKNPQIDPQTISDVYMGCANQAGEDNRNVARMAVLLADFPVTIPAETINRLCASGMSAVVQAGRAAHAGEGDVFIAGGVEQMTRGPWVISKASAPYGRDAQMFDSSFGWRFINPKIEQIYGVESMGETAENLAEKFSISREDQDAFALWSQQKAARAISRLSEEIIPLSIPVKKGEPVLFDRDEFVKPGSSAEGLSKLRPAFRANGTVTAGNASGLNDGAAALLICSEEGAKKNQFQPMVRIVSSAVTGVEPGIMGIGPVSASQLALKRAGITLNDIDIIEINEAFAAQVLACTRSLKLEDNDSRINPNGGAIALGHPLGMSGARLIYTAALQLKKTGKKYALCTMCIGVGQGYAVVLERT
ncbi:MAG: acetyl-CoA C-acyltransferase [Crocinitomicaceae bacterium]|nr:acetyl-CoA C-acyltransferase [Crocinitomicaceae bacterium]